MTSDGWRVTSIPDDPAPPEYSLWQGGVEVGRFVGTTPVLHHDEPVGASGLLQMNGARPLTPMMQTRMIVFPGQPVFQHPLEPMVVGVPPEGRSSGELLPLSDEEARGVPPDRRYEVRDSNGAVIDTDMINIQLIALPDSMDLDRARAEGWASEGRELWSVSFTRARNLEEGV